MSNIILTVTGPSLTGKSRFANLLTPYGFENVITTTTRPARQGETHGQNYYFIGEKEFESMIEKKELIEYVKVGNNYYGLSKKELLNIIANEKNGVLVIEPTGAGNVKEFCQENQIKLFQIFLDNPTDVLIERFLERFKQDNLAKNSVYAKRIQGMLLEEPENWIKPAYDGRHYYDKIFTSFNENNENEIVNEVLLDVKNFGLKKNKIK